MKLTRCGAARRVAVVAARARADAGAPPSALWGPDSGRAPQLLSRISIVVAHAALLRGRLLACWLGHDDLVDAQDGDGGIARHLDRLPLRMQQVEDAARARAALDDVDADTSLAGLVCRVHLGDHVGGVESGILGEGARHDL